MRMKIVAGNWKMNTLPAEGAALAQDIVNAIAEVPSDVQLILAPPFTHLDRVEEVIKGSAVALSAQNCADKDKGAYTGEVSAAMLAATGCTYVILGHSERREYYHETSATLNGKMAMALANGLRSIYCVGEKLEEREAGRHFDVVGSQIKEVLSGLTPEQIARQDGHCRAGAGDTCFHPEDSCGEIRSSGREYPDTLRRQLQAFQCPRAFRTE